MSGGHFNHSYSKLETMAELLEYEINNNNDTSICKYGETTCPNYGEDTVAILCPVLNSLKAQAKVMKSVEYLYSGDIDEKEFMQDMIDISKETEDNE